MFRRWELLLPAGDDDQSRDQAGLLWSVTEGTSMLRSWSGIDDVSSLCCRLQGLQAWLRLKGGEGDCREESIPVL